MPRPGRRAGSSTALRAGPVRRIACPTLVIQGTRGPASAPPAARLAAAITGAQLLVLDGADTSRSRAIPVALQPRDPRLRRPPRRRPAAGERGTAGCANAPCTSRRRSVSGHAQRDVAIADELRKLRPGLEIDWLAQHPVTRVLEARGERIHPASAYLANESGHIESESAEHDLHCFQALAADGRDPDRELHGLPRFARRGPTTCGSAMRHGSSTTSCTRTPNSKPRRTPGSPTSWAGCPCPTGAEREAFLTADYNAEMIEQIARYPRVRDRAIFVGDPEDIVPDRFGPGLPAIRDWTEQHYRLRRLHHRLRPGLSDRARPRFAPELGYAPDEPSASSPSAAPASEATPATGHRRLPTSKRRVPTYA